MRRVSTAALSGGRVLRHCGGRPHACLSPDCCFFLRYFALPRTTDLRRKARIDDAGWLAREQPHSLREEVEERAHRGNHSAPRRENRVHDSHVSLERRQQSDERAALQIVRNGETWDKDCTNPLQRRASQREEIVRA